MKRTLINGAYELSFWRELDGYCIRIKTRKNGIFGTKSGYADNITREQMITFADILGFGDQMRKKLDELEE